MVKRRAESFFPMLRNQVFIYRCCRFGSKVLHHILSNPDGHTRVFTQCTDKAEFFEPFYNPDRIRQVPFDMLPNQTVACQFENQLLSQLTFDCRIIEHQHLGSDARAFLENLLALRRGDMFKHIHSCDALIRPVRNTNICSTAAGGFRVQEMKFCGVYEQSQRTIISAHIKHRPARPIGVRNLIGNRLQTHKAVPPELLPRAQSGDADTDDACKLGLEKLGTRHRLDGNRAGHGQSQIWFAKNNKLTEGATDVSLEDELQHKNFEAMERRSRNTAPVSDAAESSLD